MPLQPQVIPLRVCFRTFGQPTPSAGRWLRPIFSSQLTCKHVNCKSPNHVKKPCEAFIINISLISVCIGLGVHGVYFVPLGREETPARIYSAGLPRCTCVSGSMAACIWLLRWNSSRPMMIQDRMLVLKLRVCLLFLVHVQEAGLEWTLCWVQLRSVRSSLTSSVAMSTSMSTRRPWSPWMTPLCCSPTPAWTRYHEMLYWQLSKGVLIFLALQGGRFLWKSFDSLLNNVRSNIVFREFLSALIDCFHK